MMLGLTEGIEVNVGYHPLRLYFVHASCGALEGKQEKP